MPSLNDIAVLLNDEGMFKHSQFEKETCPILPKLPSLNNSIFEDIDGHKNGIKDSYRELFSA